MEYKGKDVLELMIIAKNYNNAIIDLCLKNIKKNTDTILDFGAGIGTLSEIFRKKKYNVECIETDENLIDILNDKGFKTNSTFDCYVDNSIQNIVSFNVFEHIYNDVEILNEIYKKLSINGKFFLFVPAHKFLYSSFDKRLGHFRRYNKKELEYILKDCGYKIEKLFYFDSLGLIFALIYKLLNKDGTILECQIKLYDKFVYPVSRIIDYITLGLFGKNLVFVLSKDENDKY